MPHAVKGLLLSLVVGALLIFAEPSPAPALQNRDVYHTMKGIAVYATWCKAIEFAGLTQLYAKPGSVVTMFAPNEDAFAKLKKDDRDELFNSKPRLIGLITHHTIEGKKLDSEALAAKGKMRNTLVRPFIFKKDNQGNIKVKRRAHRQSGRARQQLRYPRPGHIAAGGAAGTGAARIQGIHLE